MFLQFYNIILEFTKPVEEIHYVVEKYKRDIVYVAPETQLIRFAYNITKLKYLAQSLADTDKPNQKEICSKVIEECDQKIAEIKSSFK